jgi:hypothetical protein
MNNVMKIYWYWIEGPYFILFPPSILCYVIIKSSIYALNIDIFAMNPLLLGCKTCSLCEMIANSELC